MRAYVFGRCLLGWSVVWALGLLVAGCDGGGLLGPCKPFTQVKALIKMQGEAPADGVPLPLSVLRDDELIGQVTALEQDSGPQTVLVLCLKKDAVPKLHRLIGFYWEKDPAGDRMKAEPLSEAGPPLEKEPVFLGFFDYGDLFAWKAKYFLKKSMDSLLRTLDDVLFQSGGKPPRQQPAETQEQL